MKYSIPDFSDALQQMMTRYNLSVADLTELLHYKSKTTIARALNRSTGPRGLKNLFSDLTELTEPKLAYSEVLQLENGLYVSINGQEKYQFDQELADLIFYSEEPDASQTILQHANAFLPLCDFFQQFQGSVCQCLLLNSCFSQVTSQLQILLTNSLEGSSITHYVYFQNDIHRMINGLHASLPLLQSNLYHLYSLHPQEEEHSIMGDLIVLNCHFKNGVHSEYEIFLHNETSGIVAQTPGSFEKWRLFLEHYKGSRETLKTLSNSSHIFNILHMYAQLEANNDMYKLKCDLCIAYVQDSIQRAALLDGCKALGISVPDDMIEALASIQKRRYENICSMRHLKHLILSRTAMDAFVHSGLLSDHFYLMRPFTVYERIEIISSCINQMRNNPFYHIYFLKKEVERKIVSNRMVELICFDHDCVQIIPSITNYNLSQGHTEIFIHDPYCVELTKIFYQKQLFKNYVTSYEETYKILNDFLFDLSGMIAANGK